jgi:hypothetical protein
MSAQMHALAAPSFNGECFGSPIAAIRHWPSVLVLVQRVPRDRKSLEKAREGFSRTGSRAGFA